MDIRLKYFYLEIVGDVILPFLKSLSMVAILDFCPLVVGLSISKVISL